MKTHDDPYLEYLRQEFIRCGYFCILNSGDQWQPDNFENYYHSYRGEFGFTPLFRDEWAVRNKTIAEPAPVAERCTCVVFGEGAGQWCAFCIRTGRDKEVARKIVEMNFRSLKAWRQIAATTAEPGRIAAACVPDDQPETYDQRRARIAAERNPDRVTCDHSQLDGDWWACFICGASGGNLAGHPAAGIQRAVARLCRGAQRSDGTSGWEP